jgi:hypothetical protein
MYMTVGIQYVGSPVYEGTIAIEEGVALAKDGVSYKSVQLQSVFGDYIQFI